MKPSAQANKCSSSNPKVKKTAKDREKRKSQGNNVEVNNHNSTEKGSPTKECSVRLFAGIDADSVVNYVEQTCMEHLSEDITNMLTEDINYRLRYIINDARIKGRLLGQNAISSCDIEHTFENLRIDKVYGIPLHPRWVRFPWVPFPDQTLCCLDDKVLNIIDIAEEEKEYYQYSETILTTTWIPEQKEISRPLKNYFTMMCQMIVNNDMSVRRMALTNISENNRIGSIIEWFYNFGYILLSKDITYDSLTLRALDLITVLENSRSCRINVSEKQLKLLVRLILQRLLKSVVPTDVLKPICNTLALFCMREPLKQFVVVKILQKIDEVFEGYALSIITVANSLGIDGISSIVLPNSTLFLSRASTNVNFPFTYSLLESYYILSKQNLITCDVYNSFFEYFGDSIILFNTPFNNKIKITPQKDLNFVRVKCELLRTQRKIFPPLKSKTVKPLETVFEVAQKSSRLRKKIEEQRRDFGARSDMGIVIGKKSLLLSVFKQKHKSYYKCQDHTLIAYNL